MQDDCEEQDIHSLPHGKQLVLLLEGQSWRAAAKVAIVKISTKDGPCMTNF